MGELIGQQNRLAIAFCHPDLGLGGAERLVVDAACELASCGNSVRHLLIYSGCHLGVMQNASGSKELVSSAA